MKKLLTMLTVVLAQTVVFAADDACTKDQAKAAVEKICAAIEKNADEALKEVKTYRFCGSNYVWVQDSDVKMVVHPTKPKLDLTDLKPNADENGKKLFVEFDKMAKSNKAGGWVDYVWPKPGAEKATDKTSFVKLCGGPKKWIAGSGVWK
jgi:signal transduction histidine kinase